MQCKKKKLFFLLLFLLFISWICSGFYILKEAERGVILRLGKFNHLVFPGINWKINFMDKLISINVDSVREVAIASVMLTSDENLLNVEINVQYFVDDLEIYFFIFTNPDESLRQVTESALRGVIGKYTIARILHDSTIIRSDTKSLLYEIIHDYYNIGINIIDFNFKVSIPEVKYSFDKAIAART